MGKKMQFKEPRTLWKTDVGSWMWKMNRPDSDHDYYVCYEFDSRSFLLGNTHDGGHQTHSETEDKSSFEIGMIVRQLLKGNANHVWGVLSPMISTTSEEHSRLRSLVESHPAKNCYNSIKGMSLHNLHDYFDSVTSKQKVQTMMQEDKYLYWKKLNTIARGLEFGIRILEGKGYQFLPTNYTQRSDIDKLLQDFEITYQNSSLPEEPDPEPFETFLLELRLKNLHD